MGSNAYGTNIETSDVDIKGVYLQDPFESASFSYKEQEILDKDTTFWELQRFLDLACSSNPTVLELLFSPERCILEKHPLFDIILENKHLFLTKGCKNSFLGYARQQIYKAKGLNKKMNWENDRIFRKKPIDFCKILWLEQQPNHDISLHHWFYEDSIPENTPDYFFVLSKIDNTKQLYKFWYVQKPLNECTWYHGLCNDDDLLTPAIPKDVFDDPYTELRAIIQYDLDGFQLHCREFNQYQTWLKERNTQRYVDVASHGQKIDGKNMMHCIRLIETAKDIAEKKDLIVERPNAQELLKIRRGEYNLQQLIDKADIYFEEIEKAFDKSDLPDSIDRTKVNELLINIRKESLKYFN